MNQLIGNLWLSIAAQELLGLFMSAAQICNKVTGAAVTLHRAG